MAAVAADALGQGLEAWVSPDRWDQDADTALDYIAEAARSAGELDRQWPGRVVLVVANEVTFFMRGFIEGSTVTERLKSPALQDRIRSGALTAPVNDFLSRASRAVRPAFEGSITYASLFFEPVDWTLFDFAAASLYRDARIRPFMDRVLRRLLGQGRPAVITAAQAVRGLACSLSVARASSRTPSALSTPRSRTVTPTSASAACARCSSARCACLRR